MAAPIISHVSDTARWVAVYRALESERPDALFNDPFARRLAGTQGEAIVQGLPKGRAMSWAMVVRTAVMDEIILREVGRGSIDLVLNLAAGLDARPWRLPLPPALRWIDVDHPDMVGYKSAALASEQPRCDYRALAADLADPAARAQLLANATGDARDVLVITEGLLIYLAEADVIGLARDLHAHPPIRNWLTDLASPGLLKLMAKGVGRAVAAGNAPFLFAPGDTVSFFAKLGWDEIEYRSQFHEGLRLNRTFPMARFWAFLGSLRGEEKRREFARFSGIALMQRRD